MAKLDEIRLRVTAPRINPDQIDLDARYLLEELDAANRVGAIALGAAGQHAERVELMLLMVCPSCRSRRHQSYPETCEHKFHEAFYGERMPTAEDCSQASGGADGGE